MRQSRRSRVSIAAALFALGAATPGCSTPRTPSAASATDADAGDLSCQERMRAHELCEKAVGQRCESRLHDCEASCEPGALASAGNANQATQSTFVTEIDATRCRDNCRQEHEGCERSVRSNCPTNCGAPRGQMTSDETSE
jgi:hypothetical protein